ncbi:MAG: DUF1015 domain-containing protein [Candidatus Eiseniibacteriota bacterium]|jgi:uncharacterized protein (DUF1015 family)
MARIRAFRGWRYDTARVGDLARVMAPPYDAIDATLAPRLVRRHPRNAVRLIWTGDATRPSPVAGATPGASWGGASRRGPYEDAARVLREWMADGTLVREPRPALYGYAQTYRDPEGEERTQLGFMAAVELAPYGHGIHPHERTHAPYVEDRLALLRATRAHVSPIFGLYSDPEHHILGLLRSSPHDGEVRWSDTDRVAHALWVVDEPGLIDTLDEAMRSRDIVIADGHHRYQAALRYLQECRPVADGARDATVTNDPAVPAPAAAGGDGADQVLMFLTAMEDRGSMVLPIHRSIAGIRREAVEQLVDALAAEARIELAGDLDQAMAAVGIEARSSRPAAAGDASRLIRFVLLTRHQARIVSVPATPETTAAAVATRLVIERGLGWDPEEAARDGRLTYTSGWRETAAGVLTGHHAAACLLPATPVEQIVATARAGRTLPPKSTYFHPKVPTGPVMHVIDR